MSCDDSDESKRGHFGSAARKRERMQ